MKRTFLPVLALSLSIFVAGCGGASGPSPTHTSAIRAVLALDKANTPQPDFLEMMFGRTKTSVTTYLIKLEAIDLSDCPADFQEVFQKHVRAWQVYEEAYLAGDSAAIAAASRDIRETWVDVHHIAKKYGVTTALHGD